MGSVLLLLITPPKTCNCLSKYELETINFIVNVGFANAKFELFEIGISDIEIPTYKYILNATV
ncbi:hypothetical protein GCM10011344_08740 [Dokdonia pacifica]|nr:hypothetical protein GCM10011344_08740 [Dokdonia pacifica]